jgi:hypothetical protein
MDSDFESEDLQELDEDLRSPPSNPEEFRFPQMTDEEAEEILHGAHNPRVRVMFAEASTPLGRSRLSFHPIRISPAFADWQEVLELVRTLSGWRRVEEHLELIKFHLGRVLRVSTKVRVYHALNSYINLFICLYLG